MAFKPIDAENWERKEFYEHFINEAVCTYSVVVNFKKIPKRQVITNGYFSKNADKICEVAEQLAACGVNDMLLSVDAYTIPVVCAVATVAEIQGWHYLKKHNTEEKR